MSILGFKSQDFVCWELKTETEVTSSKILPPLLRYIICPTILNNTKQTNEGRQQAGQVCVHHNMDPERVSSRTPRSFRFRVEKREEYCTHYSQPANTYNDIHVKAAWVLLGLFALPVHKAEDGPEPGYPAVPQRITHTQNANKNFSNSVSLVT